MVKKLKYKKILATILLLITILSIINPIFAVSGNADFVGGQYASKIRTTDNNDADGILIRKLTNRDTGEKYTVFCAEHGVSFATSTVYNGTYYS